MTLKTCTILIATMALAACGRGSEGTEKPAPAASTAAEAPHKEDSNTVEVDEGMLRDLRITTRAVGSRTGGDLVMLLGELAVDERAYAEVGTPVAARVTRLHASAGDHVRSGQTLVELTSPELARERAEYLSARARLTLAEAALERKRGLAAEKIAPLREVQEAESAAGRRGPRFVRRARRSPHSASTRPPTTAMGPPPRSSSCGVQ